MNLPNLPELLRLVKHTVRRLKLERSIAVSFAVAGTEAERQVLADILQMLSRRSVVGRHAVLQTVCTEEHALDSHSEHPQRGAELHTRPLSLRRGKSLEHLRCRLLSAMRARKGAQVAAVCAHPTTHVRQDSCAALLKSHACGTQQVCTKLRTVDTHVPASAVLAADTAFRSASSSRTYMSCSHMLRP